MPVKSTLWAATLVVGGIFSIPLALAIPVPYSISEQMLTVGYYTDADATNVATSAPPVMQFLVNSTPGVVELTAWPGTLSTFRPRLTIDAIDNTITISNVLETSGSWPANLFLGFRDVLGAMDPFFFDPTRLDSTRLLSTVSGLDSSALRVTADAITLNLGSVTLPGRAAGGVIALQVGFQGGPTPGTGNPVIPEPASLALFGLGGLLLGSVIRRRH